MNAYSIGQIAIIIVVVLAVCGLVLVATRAMGIEIPAWLKQVLGILLVAFVVIVAIRFLLSM